MSSLIENFNMAIEGIDKYFITDWDVRQELVDAERWCTPCAKKYGPLMMEHGCIHGLPELIGGRVEVEITLKSGDNFGVVAPLLSFKMPNEFYGSKEHDAILEMTNDVKQVRAILVTWRDYYLQMTAAA